jgi:hypothetical protein
MVSGVPVPHAIAITAATRNKDNFWGPINMLVHRLQ